MIGIVDYGVGNLFSLSASLKFLGADSRILSDPQLGGAERLILPGVGAFGDAAEKLRGPAWPRRCCAKQKPANSCWASAWGCSFCLKEL
jgi:glutamine amidotransferase